MSADRPYRILSLDGGGSWALIQVMALIEIYGRDTRGHDVLADFDLVAANSGGSLTLGGLFTDKTLGEVLDQNFLDEAKRRSVFTELPFDIDFEDKPFRAMWHRLMRLFANVGAKYRTEAKYDGLRALLDPVGDRDLLDLHSWVGGRKGTAPHVLIVGFDYDMKRAKFFRSDIGSLSGSTPSEQLGARLREDFAHPRSRLPTLAQAIHASSNAPVKFFMSPAEIDNGQHTERYWDGAIAGYNNPVLAALVEALANRNRYRIGTLAEITILSLGTGTVARPTHGRSADKRLVASERKRSTLHGDLEQLAMSILDDPPDSATYTAHVMLGQPLPDPNGSGVRPPVTNGSVVRMSPVIRPVRDTCNTPWRLPDGMKLGVFEKLRELDLDAVDTEDVDRLVEAGRLWIAGSLPNQAIRENKEYECQIGHATFGEALAAWRALVQRSGGMRGLQPEAIRSAATAAALRPVPAEVVTP